MYSNIPETGHLAEVAKRDDGLEEPSSSQVSQNEASVVDLGKAVVRVPNLDSRYLNAVHRALSVFELLLMIMSCVKDALGWDDDFLSRSFSDSGRDRRRALFKAKDFLALSSVNSFWRETFKHLHSAWAVIPAALANEESSLKSCALLASPSQLELTLTGMPRESLLHVLKKAEARITSVRLISPRQGAFYEDIQRTDMIDFIASVTALEVRCDDPELPVSHWIRSSPPRLETLSLTNFLFSKSCVLPSTLRALTLDFTRPPSTHITEPMDVPALLNALAHLPVLERLRVDLCYMPEGVLTKEDQADLSMLKRLSVRTQSRQSFISLVTHLSFPALERAHLNLQLGRGNADDVRISSTKLAQLVLRGGRPSNEEPDHIDLGNVYIDHRRELIRKAYGNWTTTVALASRKDYLSLTDAELSTDRIVSTAAFVMTVRRFFLYDTRVQTRSPSFAVDHILAGLPSLDVASVTVHCLPTEKHPSIAENHGLVVLPFDDTAFIKHVSSAHRLNWFGHCGQLADIMSTPTTFPRLKYLTTGRTRDVTESKALLQWLEGVTGIEKDKRQSTQVPAAAQAPSRGTKPRRKAKKEVAVLPIVPPESVLVNVTKMFGELLYAVSAEADKLTG